MQALRKIIDVHGTQVVLELPPTFVNHRVEFIALTLDEEPPALVEGRQPNPPLAGKGRTLGDLVSPIVDPDERAKAP